MLTLEPQGRILDNVDGESTRKTSLIAADKMKANQRNERMEAMKKQFKVGETYSCVALYGGWYWIKVVDRTDDKIFFVYDERTSDDRSVQEADIVVKENCTVYGKELEELGQIDVECAVAWKYHSQYAEDEDDVDYGYYSAFDFDQLYTAEEYKAMVDEDTADQESSKVSSKYSVDSILAQRKEAEEDMKRVQEAQDGSFAHNIPAYFVGGKYNGLMVDHKTLMEMGNGQFTLRWSQCKEHNPLLLNLDLEDQPMVDGYLSPMQDGDRLRYETQEVYDLMFD